MIFLTGDLHGEYGILKLNTKNFPEQKELTKKDLLIVTGDFGLVWDNSRQEKYWLNWLEKKNFTTLFVPGNHENYDLLSTYPKQQYCGGLVRYIRNSIMQLDNGYVFNLDGILFFTFGGAESTDKEQRIVGKSWWPQEIPSWGEFERSYINLSQHQFCVDYVLTHTAPMHVIAEMAECRKDDPVSKMLSSIDDAIQYKKWFFGHMHVDRLVMDKFHCLYDSIIRIT